jgi:hypothetical protein
MWKSSRRVAPPECFPVTVSRFEDVRKTVEI